jgi:Fe-S-cluster containining protein
MSESAKNPLPWYKDGLNFECTQCGQCCTGGPGFIWVSDQEISGMAHFLNLSVDVFKRLYLRKRENRYALVEKKSQNHNCVFLKDNKCQVYQARPEQCRTFPWWKENLNTEESWKIAATFCEGIRVDAPLIPYKEIIKNFDLFPEIPSPNLDK